MTLVAVPESRPDDELIIIGPALVCALNDQGVLVPLGWVYAHDPASPSSRRVFARWPDGVVWWHERDDTSDLRGQGRDVIIRGSE